MPPRRRRRRRRGSQRQLPMGVLIARGQTLALETLRLCRQCAAVAYGPLRRFADMKESVMAIICFVLVLIVASTYARILQADAAEKLDQMRVRGQGLKDEIGKAQASLPHAVWART